MFVRVIIASNSRYPHTEMRREGTREVRLLSVAVREVSRGFCSVIAEQNLRNLSTAVL
jgi:microcystin degradation protein MlrC